MKKKIALIAIAAVVIGNLIGCNSTTSTALGNYDVEYLGKVNPNISEYKDTTTGVHYFYVAGTGMCPRYNTDGTLYVD